MKEAHPCLQGQRAATSASPCTSSAVKYHTPVRTYDSTVAWAKKVESHALHRKLRKPPLSTQLRPSLPRWLLPTDVTKFVKEKKAGMGGKSFIAARTRPQQEKGDGKKLGSDPVMPREFFAELTIGRTAFKKIESWGGNLSAAVLPLHTALHGNE